MIAYIDYEIFFLLKNSLNLINRKLNLTYTFDYSQICPIVNALFTLDSFL